MSSLFLLVNLAIGLLTLLIFSKNQHLVLLIFPFNFLFLISLISALIFIISFLLLALVLNCSSFFSFLMWILRLLILDLYSFLIYVCNATNFPLHTVSAASF